ncbi:HAMP domain-containing sensor histidine kinase [Actinoplanes sp. NPDC048796]|uniref:sensor histidine kinase n=1 Tax=Actinoplanes sp. NPDC048796 TaxID=3155640 RepID=UPI0033F119BA
MRTAHEQRRLAALHEYGLLDAPAGDELEAVVRVAATLAGVPTATLNLIDENRQCQLTTTGFEGSDTARADSMCAIRFETGEFTYLPDARADPAYAENPWVTGKLADVRFYVSVPLMTPQGYALGSLCVFHNEVHELNPGQMDRLRDLAQVILALFERRRQARVVLAQHAELERAHAERAATIAELSRSNTELEQFAGVVSHDLAAPLSVVSGYLELLGERIRGTDPQSEKWIAAGTRAVGRMQRLITSLLTYARAGNAPYQPEPVPLGDLVELALTDLRGSIAGATVAVRDDLPVIEGDPLLVRQLLQNLISNALKYRRPDRPCRIEITAVPLEHNCWRVDLADNGRGIPPAQRDRVFEMFAQVDPSAGTGYGVGLSTCQRIVDRHGGEIHAEQTPGGGTTVWFTLPAPGRPA